MTQDNPTEPPVENESDAASETTVENESKAAAETTTENDSDGKTESAAENGNNTAAENEPVVDLGSKDIERYLSVGLVSIVDMQPHDLASERYDGMIIGWRPKSFIIWQTRVDPKRPWRIVHDDLSVLRFFFDGHACAIKTYLLDWQARGNSRIVYLAWPEEVRYRIVRKQRRIETELYCEVTLASGETLWGTLMQLDGSGCRIFLPVEDVKDKPLNASFALPNGIQITDLPIVVRHATPSNDGVIFGCESNTASLSPRKRSALQYFVETTIALQGTQKEATRAAIFLSKKGEEHEDLVSALRAERLDAAVVHSVIECFGWLQTRGAGAVFIDGGVEELSAIEVARIIQDSDGFKSTPLYICGGNESELKAAAESSGANYLPSLDCTPELVEMITGILTKPSDA